jgi:predicted phosphohydrolase
VRETLDDSCFALQNDVYVSEDGKTAVAGSRMWNLEGLSFGDILLKPTKEACEVMTAPKERDREHDARIFQRELGRLETSLSKIPETAQRRIAMVHFAPTEYDPKPTPVTELLEKYHVEICVFGHLHNVREGVRFDREFNGVRYVLTSCDYLDFQLAEIAEI